METLKKVTEILFTSLLVVVFPIVAVTLIASRSPVLFGLRSYVVMTGSMEPTIGTGSILYTKPERTYKNGDIVAFKSGDVVITHRIIKAQDQTGQNISFLTSPLLAKSEKLINYQTKGDANSSVDNKLVSKSQVLGKALIHIPYLGRIVASLKTPVGFILLIVVPTLLFVAFELVNIKKELDKRLEKKIMERFNVW